MAHAQPCQIAICGHSFPERLINLIRSQNVKLDQDFGLSNTKIDWITRGGWTFDTFCLEGLPRLQGKVFDLVIIDLGSNDIDSHTGHIQIGDQAISVAQQLLSNGIAVRVVLLEVLPRYSQGRTLPPQQFNQKAHDYNLFLRSVRSILTNSRLPTSSPDFFIDKKLWFWSHRKLYSPHMYDQDGIHLRATQDSSAMKRYFEDIKAAIIRHLRYPQYN